MVHIYYSGVCMFWEEGGREGEGGRGREGGRGGEISRMKKNVGGK